MTSMKQPQADDAVKAGKRASDGAVVPLARPPPSIPGVVLASTVELEVIRWLWRHWLARGTITFLDGDPGLGKSTALVDVAARITRGDRMPDDSPGLGRPGCVLFVLGEDPKSVLCARLAAAGADMGRVCILDFIREEDGTERIAVLPDDVPRIEQIVRAFKVDLVVFDPWFAFVGSDIDTKSDSGSRRALTPVAKMAEAQSCNVIALRHWKKGSGSAIQRGMDSMAHTAAARAVLSVGCDPDDEKLRILACAKTNLGPMPTSIGFGVEGTTLTLSGENIVDKEGNAVETSRVVWHGSRLVRADQLASPIGDGEDRTKLEGAMDFLRVELRDGPRPVKQLQAGARDAGIGWRTIETAKAKLQVISVRQTFSGAWTWALPEPATPQDRSEQTHSAGLRPCGLGTPQSAQDRKDDKDDCGLGDPPREIPLFPPQDRNTAVSTRANAAPVPVPAAPIGDRS